MNSNLGGSCRPQGMYHHNYFAGTPSMIMAVGSCFSCLEVCPLALMGMEASEYIALEKAATLLAQWYPFAICLVQGSARK